MSHNSPSLFLYFSLICANNNSYQVFRYYFRYKNVLQFLLSQNNYYN